jgi:hypothetical protein
LCNLLSQSISEDQRTKDEEKKMQKLKQKEVESKVLIQEVKPTEQVPNVVSDVVREN